MSMKQISAKIPDSLRKEFYDKCDEEGQIYTVTLALILEKFIDDEYRELFNKDE